MNRNNVAVRLLLTWLLALPGVATAADGAVVGSVTHLAGVLSAKTTDASRVLGIRSDVREGDLLTTEGETYARIKFVDGGEVVLRPNSQMKIDKYAFSEARAESDGVVLSLVKGGLRALTGLIGKRSRDKVQYNTATATIGIRGTNVGLLYCNNDCGNIPTPTGRPLPNGTHADVASGAVVMSNAGGSQLIGAGQFGFAASQTSTPVLVPPSQGVQVTMPQSISSNAAGGRSVGGQNRGTTCSF